MSLMSSPPFSRKERINHDLLELIRKDREGERIEQNLVKGVIQSLRTPLTTFISFQYF